MIFDAHIHYKNKETGGFIVGLEGIPSFPGTLTNKQVLALHNPQANYYSFYYVSLKGINEKVNHEYLKYHPRREKYSVKEIIHSIKINKPKAVIIDTLNEPYMIAYDYWLIARTFPDLNFIFAHAGGYLINDFIKICHFQKNVWLDFSLTHTLLGNLGNKKNGLSYVNDAINYALNSPFKERILLASDYPFFDQKEVFDFYQERQTLLNENFLKLGEKIK